MQILPIGLCKNCLKKGNWFAGVLFCNDAEQGVEDFESSARVVSLVAIAAFHCGNVFDDDELAPAPKGT